MALCYPNVNFITNVPDHINEILLSECRTWDYKNQKPAYNRAFYKYTTRSYTVSKFSGEFNSPKNLQPALDWICNLFENYVPYGATFIAMSPGQRYPAHADAFKYATVARRMHIPIISKPGNQHISFHKDENSKWTSKSWVMEEKKLYELNNEEPHAAENLSDEWRIHFIVDIIDKHILNNSSDLHYVYDKQILRSSMIERELSTNNELSKWTFNFIASENFLSNNI